MVNQTVFSLEELIQIGRTVMPNQRLTLVHQYILAWAQDQERKGTLAHEASLFRMTLGFMKDVEKICHLVKEECPNNEQY